MQDCASQPPVDAGIPLAQLVRRIQALKRTPGRAQQPLRWSWSSVALQLRLGGFRPRDAG